MSTDTQQTNQPPSPVRRGYSTLSTGQAHWRRSGPVGNSANPVICLHMMPKSSRAFTGIVAEIGKTRLCVAPDFPGYGASDPLAVSASVAGYADWFLELLDVLEIDGPVDVIGYHTGSMVAVAAAHSRPERFGRLIAISAPAFTADECAQLHEYFQPIPIDESGHRFTVMWERILKYRGPGMSLEMAAESMSDNLLGGEAYEEGHRAAFDYAAEFLESIRAIPHRLLVMNIADDLQEATRRIDPFLNNGKRQEYPQWGNGFLEVHTTAVAEEMLRFLNDA